MNDCGLLDREITLVDRTLAAGQVRRSLLGRGLVKESPRQRLGLRVQLRVDAVPGENGESDIFKRRTQFLRKLGLALVATFKKQLQVTALYAVIVVLAVQSGLFSQLVFLILFDLLKTAECLVAGGDSFLFQIIHLIIRR